MDTSFPICHLFYYPTEVVLVDDDPDFLDAVSLLLRRDLSYRLFQSANQALEHVNNSNQHIEMVRRCYSSYKTGPFESDTLNHIDINEIYKEVYNLERFSTPSVVVVDYSMPEMNGLEYCMNLSNPYVKKILLTGQADTDLAVQAFNDGLIDQYISKKDQNLQAKLNRSISNLQQHYFSRTFKLITDPVIANNQSRFINNPDFVNFFRDILLRDNIAEYYLIDEPYTGFFMLNENGTPSILLIMSAIQLENHISACIDVGAQESLIKALKAGELIPLFKSAESDAQLEANVQEGWQEHYIQCQKISDRAPYYCAQLSADEALKLLPNFEEKRVVPYGPFLNEPKSAHKLVH
ncbi:MAG: response regulator [Pseudohongiellaceae bacterium]|nr:response regulator [Pseudohongiellaceae bacterium]